MPDKICISGKEIPRIGFGTLYITQQRGFGPPRDNAIDLLREAAELGIKFFDTADSYGNGSAEEALHDALYPYDGLIIATKGGYRHQQRGAWRPDARPEHLRKALEGSLKRLQLETIDLYQLHCGESRVSYADSIGALVDMKNDGKIRHIGISNVDLTQLETALRETEVVSVQNAFNVQHSWNVEILNYCTNNSIPFLPWMPLGDGSISWTDPTLCNLGKKYAVLPAQIALAALINLSPIMLPIPGTSSSKHLHENVAAAKLKLDDEDMSTLWKQR